MDNLFSPSSKISKLGTKMFGTKVYVPCLVFDLKWTSILEKVYGWCESKNGHQKHM